MRLSASFVPACYCRYEYLSAVHCADSAAAMALPPVLGLREAIGLTEKAKALLSDQAMTARLTVQWAREALVLTYATAFRHCILLNISLDLSSAGFVENYPPQHFPGSSFGCWVC